MINAREIPGNQNVVFITLDTLRYDIAQKAMDENKTPNLKALFDQWEIRQSPGSFTYAAHHAFFAGFLPTPVNEPHQERLFSLEFEGSKTTGSRTLSFDNETLIAGFKSIGYYTLCVGGVGFFNKKTPLGKVLPSMFCESHWDQTFSVTDKQSTKNQIEYAINRLIRREKEKFFLFINISAIHQPNYYYQIGNETKQDSIETHQLALEYVDQQLPVLFEWLKTQGTNLIILCSDHGTSYGEDNYFGHRLAHPVVWTVPYAEFIL